MSVHHSQQSMLCLSPSVCSLPPHLGCTSSANTLSSFFVILSNSARLIPPRLSNIYSKSVEMDANVVFIDLSEDAERAYDEEYRRVVDLTQEDDDEELLLPSQHHHHHHHHQ